jgi:hypothetical protein
MSVLRLSAESVFRVPNSFFSTEAAVCAAAERVKWGFLDVGAAAAALEEAEDRRITGVQSCMVGLGAGPARPFIFYIFYVRNIKTLPIVYVDVP